MSNWKAKAFPLVAIALVEKAAQRGIAVSAAVAKRGEGIASHFNVSWYEDRCKTCMPENEIVDSEAVPHKGESVD